MKRIVLFLYNLLFLPILLILLPGYLVRIGKRGGYRNRALQRFGMIDQTTLERLGTGRIWLHAVSVGEVGIALKLASEYHRRNPSSRFLVSTTTSTGLAILERSASAWLEPMANPIDFPYITGHLIKQLRPAALLMVEADLWPNRIAACKKLGIPVALINARLSTRSKDRFRMARALSAPFFNQLDLITLTDPEDQARWISLGVRPELLHLTGNIKHDSPASVTTAPASDPILLAASTHDGEESEVAKAWISLKSEFPNLRLILAPRHAERRGEVRTALEKIGIPCRPRSEGADLSEVPLLLDTTGGQNMIDPLQAGTPVLIGPHTGNFEPLASRLCSAGAAIRVNDSEEIASAAQTLLCDPEKRSSMITSAIDVLRPHQGAAVRNSELVKRLLQDLRSSAFGLQP